MFILHICFERWPAVILNVGSPYFRSQNIATCSKSQEPLAKEMKDVIAVYKVIHVASISIMQ